MPIFLSWSTVAFLTSSSLSYNLWLSCSAPHLLSHSLPWGKSVNSLFTWPWNNIYLIEEIYTFQLKIQEDWPQDRWNLCHHTSEDEMKLPLLDLTKYSNTLLHYKTLNNNMSLTKNKIKFKAAKCPDQNLWVKVFNLHNNMEHNEINEICRNCTAFMYSTCNPLEPKDNCRQWAVWG